MFMYVKKKKGGFFLILGVRFSANDMFKEKNERKMQMVKVDCVFKVLLGLLLPIISQSAKLTRKGDKSLYYLIVNTFEFIVNPSIAI